MHKLKATLFFLFLCLATEAWAAIRVNVVGLFNDKAIVMINGSGPHSLSAGQTKQGVKLGEFTSQVQQF